ncbi:MAG: FMN-binding protein [Eubacteriales bacterium]|nr:FMN-binding protein [Eubacteriales bacterium]
MKKTISILTILSCILLLAGCGASDTKQDKTYEIAEAGTWTDGTYTETVKGKKGDFEVTVTIENGDIVSVTVGDNQETPDKGGAAIAQLPEEIVAAQSYDVDAVSGATVTSDGIKDAVARCLEKASQTQ